MSKHEFNQVLGNLGYGLIDLIPDEIRINLNPLKTVLKETTKEVFGVTEIRETVYNDITNSSNSITISTTSCLKQKSNKKEVMYIIPLGKQLEYIKEHNLPFD